MLVGAVDERIVGTEERKLKAPVQVYTISIEEEGKDSPQQIQIYREEKWDHENWRSPCKLIHPFISNNSKRTWVIEDVVILVNVPEKLGYVPSVVICPLKQISPDPQYKKAHDVILPRIPA